VSLRVADITDLDIAKQVATLALAENERLYARLEALTKQLAALEGKRSPEQLELELLRVREQMMALQRRMFAASSEKRARESDAAAAKPEPPTGTREQRKLPLEEHVHELDADERACTTCGRDMVEWHGQHEEVEEVDVVRREFVLKKHRRTKYRCRCGASPRLATGPLRLPGGGRYALDFAIEVAVSKHLDHTPLERQVRIMRREGLDIDSSTLWEQCERLARVLEPTAKAIRAYVVQAPVVHADETPWYMLKKGRQKQWMWSLSCHDAAFYRIDPSRGHHVIVELLAGFDGLLVVDGYAAYSTAARALGGRVRLALCWAHARRALLEAEESYPTASEALDLIGEMFLIERDLPDWRYITDEALRTRALSQIRDARCARSKPLVEALAAWARAQRALPGSRLGEAITYLNNQWDGLCVFLDDPRVPLSNNAAERAVRGPVVGRKNFAGCKSVRGTEVAAVLYTLLESAKLARVEPRAYLRAAAEAALCGREPLPPHVHREQTRPS
jgi:transposase